MGGTEAVLRVALVCLAFFIVHSIMVTGWFKSLMSRLTGERIMKGFYRLFFTGLSMAGSGLCIWLILMVPDRHIYSFPPWIGWPMHGVQLLGLLFGYLSYRQLSTGEFTGSAQAMRYLRGEEPGGDVEGMREQGLTRAGGYGVVRNPLYFAGIVVFAFNPYLTRTWLTVSALSALYFIWGAWIEERRMLLRFGDQYREYMAEVPWLIPGPGGLIRWLGGLRG